MNHKDHTNHTDARVGIVMGSDSDFPTLENTLDVLREQGFPYEVHIVSAHRTPAKLFDYATLAADRGLQVIIAAAGGAAHLPGMVASLTVLPVIGVPVKTRTLEGYDSLLSILQMPAGVPVATVAVGDGRSAGEIAARIIGISAI
jgi:5-(carboxyamino)imidazole ribonucleotide mutase